GKLGFGKAVRGRKGEHQIGTNVSEEGCNMHWPLARLGFRQTPRERRGADHPLVWRVHGRQYELIDIFGRRPPSPSQLIDPRRRYEPNIGASYVAVEHPGAKGKSVQSTLLTKISLTIQ